MDPHAVARSIVVLVLMSAALSDCSGHQAAQLREEMRPVLDRYREGDAELVDTARVVQHVMGPDWEPTGERGDYLRLMLRGLKE